MDKIRQDHELPECIASWGWKFHHIGIPTKEQKENEEYLPHFKLYTAGFSQNPFGVEWMRYEPGCKISQLVQQVPHIAFEVKDLDWELENRDFEILTPPNPSSEGVRVAMIVWNGAPIELIEFEKNK